MKNLNNKKSLELINKIVISRYISDLKNIRTGTIKLYRTFPYTGAVNISESVSITMFKNTEDLLLKRHNFSKN